MKPDPLELARHIDCVRRRTTPMRPGVVTRELPSGWLSARPGADPGQFPSASANRVHWLTAERPIGESEVAAATAAARELGLTRLYAWLAPWAWNHSVERVLTSSGAQLWPHLAYVALARPAGEAPQARATSFEVRVLAGDELAEKLGETVPWYSADSVSLAVRLANEGISETHAAIESGRVVALGALTMDGNWGYLGAAGTDPAHRQRGAQGALIASRVRRAAKLGAAWCASETNTAVPISLRNLERSGFEETIFWRVYWWDFAPSGE